MSPFTPRANLQTETLPAVQIEICAFCSYSLEGLPSAGLCPECGIAYDETAYVIRAVMRGTSGMAKSRALLWVGLAITAWWEISLLTILFGAYGVSYGSFGSLFAVVVWCAIAIYLIRTNKQHRGQKGVDHIVFCAAGFGPCTLQDGASTPIDVDLTPWSEVDGFVFRSIGTNFQRLRIGRKHHHTEKLKLEKVLIDVGLRCTRGEADVLGHFIRQRIDPTRSCPE